MAEYNLMPWDIGRLTADELVEILDHQIRRYKAIEEANRG